MLVAAPVLVMLFSTAFHALRKWHKLLCILEYVMIYFDIFLNTLFIINIIVTNLQLFY